MEVVGRRLLKVVASAAAVGATFIGGKYSEKFKNAATTPPNEVSVQYKDLKLAYVTGKEENKALLNINVTADGAVIILKAVGGAVAVAGAGYLVYRILKQINNKEQNNNEQNNNEQNNNE